MAYEYDAIRKSQEIFYKLLSEHELTEEKEQELYRAYSENEEISNLVKSQGEVAGCNVERYGNVIYLLPKLDNTFLGFSKADLKKEVCKSGATDRDYYLSQFIILTLLVEFYDGQGRSCKARTFMKLGELQNIVSEKLKQGVDQAGEEENEEMSPHFDYQSMWRAYEALKSDSVSARTKWTKEGMIKEILSFLERQRLITYIQEDEMIRTTLKLDHLMELKLCNRENYDKIMELLKGDENE